METSFCGFRDPKQPEKMTQFLPSDLFEIGADIMRAIYIYEKGSDPEITPFTKESVEKDIQENFQFYRDLATNNKDSGSDSDPEADEFNMREKLKKFMSPKVAKTVGIETSNASVSNNTGNGS